MILAVLASPLIAVQVQKRIEKLRDKRSKKLQIFHTLMSTRGSRLSPAHVGALNMIDSVFSPKRSAEKKVLDAW